MNPQPFEIYEANVRLEAVGYARPCLVVSVENQGKISVFPISSAMELYSGPHLHFRIDSTDPDFARTGLTVDSYVIGARYVPLDVCNLIRKRGQLEGELLKRFLKWF